MHTDYLSIIERADPSQTHSEMAELLGYLESNLGSIKRVLEIGVHRGGSMRVWSEVFHPELLIGVDWLPEPESIADGFIIIPGKSQDQSTLDRVLWVLEGKLLDFLFIDGSHYYEDVKKDFELYSPLVREGGAIAFHDVILEGNDTVEVYRFWNEIKDQYNTTTISHKDVFGPGATGTGVIWK